MKAFEQFSLKIFDSTLEDKFRDYTASKDKSHIRIAFILFALLYGMFSITDYILLPHRFELFFGIRFYVVIPLFVLTFILTFSPLYQKWKQGILVLNYVVGGSAISIMLALEPLNIIYYGGFFLIFTAGYFMLNLSPVNAVFSSVCILIVILSGTYLTGNYSLMVSLSLLFLISENIIGAIGAFQLDQFRRKEFLNIYELNEARDSLHLTVKEQIEEISAAQISTIRALAFLAESRDKETGEHIERVGELCRQIANAIPIKYYETEEEKIHFCDTMSLASALHDIGKVGISDKILNKPGSLNDEEFKIMCTHPSIGSETLEKLLKQYPNNYFVQKGIEITHYHHEKWDGSGYPVGLKGLEIPLSARIMAIADVYDALISKRPYKEPFTHEEAVRIIKRDSGKHFDPELVKSFCSLF